jgi:hypothetical protein
MRLPTCPFHIECEFHNSQMKTPSDELLGQFFCHMRYEGCEIAKRIVEGKPVPVGACPDGNIKG